jgi:hypothetical protein
MGQSLYLADHATSDLSYLESGICGYPSMCVIIRQFDYPPNVTLDRPKLRLSYVGLEHFERYHEVGAHHCNGSKTSQAVRYLVYFRSCSSY